MPNKQLGKSIKGGSLSTTTKSTAQMHKSKSSSTKSIKGSSKKAKTAKKTKKAKKAKKSKKPMPKGYGYCLNPKCRKQVKFLTHKETTTKNGRKQMVGKGECGHEVYRFI